MRGRLLVLLVVLGLVATACARAGAVDPSDLLIDALRGTAAESFTYRLTVELDDDARSSLDGAPAHAAAFGSLTLTGRVNGASSTASVGLGSTEIAEIMVVDDRHLYARVTPDGLTLLGGGARGIADVTRKVATFPGRLGEIGSAVLTGAWLGLELDREELSSFGLPVPPLSHGEIAERIEEHVGDPAAFIAEHVSVTEDADADLTDGVRVLHLEVAAREAARELRGVLSEMLSAGHVAHAALAWDDLPESLTGITVHVIDRRIHRVEIDLVEAAGAGGRTVRGTAHLVLELRDHGAAESIVAPAEVLILTPGEISAAQTLAERRLLNDR